MSDTAEGASMEPGDGADYGEEPQVVKPAPKKRGRVKSMSELKANFAGTFGAGPGRIALFAIGLFVAFALAFGIRGLHAPSRDESTGKFDVPKAPQPEISAAPVDAKEAARRRNQAAIEADAAASKGKTYQPDFTPVIASAPPKPAAVDMVAPDNGERRPPIVPDATVAADDHAAPAASSPTLTAAQTQQLQQEANARKTETEKQLAARDKYVDGIQKRVFKQSEEILAGDKGAYSSVSYVPLSLRTSSGAGQGGGAGAGERQSASASEPTARKIPVFRAGRAVFATLDTGVNTDDGTEVFGTLHGGRYDGAKLIGKVQQSPRNIGIHFDQLVPQDDRPSIRVNAIAIRETDARQGVAEDIDNHTLERYSALFAGSILSGAGKAAAATTTPNSTVLNNGTTIVQQPELSPERIALFALGDIGTNAGAEVRKTFSEPATYSIPAHQGIGVVFLADVFEPIKGDQ